MGDLYFDTETKEILDSLPSRGKSKFVRDAIKEKKYGHNEKEPETTMVLPLVEIVEE